MKLATQLKAVPLLIESAFFVLIPFLRTFILTHLLFPYEFGFASALAATYATFEQITDVGIRSFVFSSPRSVYSEAIGGAHAISIIRGLCVGGVLLSASIPVACAFATCGDWPSFAWLVPATIINSFEHFEVRVKASRDYKYWPQLITSAVSHGSGLVAMSLVAYKFENHYGYIAYLLVQSAVGVITTHLLASDRYSVNFRTPFVRKALVFGLPLLMNGIGLAIMSQGDRWIVGSLLGLPILGLYSVMTLSAFVPVMGLSRILSPIQFAGLHNARAETGKFEARLKLYSRVVPAIAAASALGIIAVYGPLVPAVFGHQFAISDLEIVLLALIVYFRIIRSDPQNSLLFNAQETRKLAIAGQAPFIGLLATAGLVIAHPRLEFVLIGTLVGEIVGLWVIGYVSRRLLKSALYDHIFSALLMSLIVVLAGLSVLATKSGDVLIDRLVIVGVFLIAALAFIGPSLPGLYRQAYSAAQ